MTNSTSAVDNIPANIGFIVFYSFKLNLRQLPPAPRPRLIPLPLECPPWIYPCGPGPPTGCPATPVTTPDPQQWAWPIELKPSSELGTYAINNLLTICIPSLTRIIIRIPSAPHHLGDVFLGTVYDQYTGLDIIQYAREIFTPMRGQGKRLASGSQIDAGRLVKPKELGIMMHREGDIRTLSLERDGSDEYDLRAWGLHPEPATGQWVLWVEAI